MFKYFFQSKLFSLAAILVIVFFIFLIMGKIPALIAVQKESKNLEQKVQEAQRAKSELEKLSGFLGSDAYLERQARIKLNYKKSDENVVFVYKNPHNQEKPETQPEKSFGRRIKDWFADLLKK